VGERQTLVLPRAYPEPPLADNLVSFVAPRSILAGVPMGCAGLPVSR
jgi:hypothetical protein